MNDAARSDGTIGAIGFCMSGPLVMALAQTMPEKVAAIASIHGAWVVTDKDDSPHTQIDQIKAEVYFAWADNDPTATEEERGIMHRSMSDAAINYRIELMEGALHGFAPPGGERYDRVASERHWERVHALLQRNL
jgi:carboxymethylenebutenolidase